MTDAETKLWKRLNRKQLGVMFRRQYPFEKYIVDFVSFDSGLIVEVDGGQHAESEEDKVRDAWFVSKGFKVLRFWNNDVLKNIEGVYRGNPARSGTTTINPALTSLFNFL